MRAALNSGQKPGGGWRHGRCGHVDRVGSELSAGGGGGELHRYPLKLEPDRWAGTADRIFPLNFFPGRRVRTSLLVQVYC